MTGRVATRTALATALALMCAVAACSSDGGGGGGSGGEGSAADKPTEHYPLTGEVAKSGVPDRTALVVKVDNTEASEPQVGLNSADIVVEELVEGGATRLAVMLQSKLPGEIGPVRSLRTSDIGIVDPTNGVLVASGGAGVAERELRKADIPFRTESSAGYERDSGRAAPYNLMADPKQVLDGLKGDATDPPAQDYLSWAEPDAALPSGSKVTSARVSFSPGQTTEWAYVNGKGWTRENGFAAAGDGFVADSLLVVRVDVRDAGYTDPAGNPVPETVLTGGGKAQLLLGNHRVKARWEKGDAADAFRFSTPAGKELKVPPGRTWIELVPKTGGVSTS